MNLNTTKTVLGYWMTLLRKYVPGGGSARSVNQIYNHLPINGRLSTSGQPTEAQFQRIRDEGFTTVINLAPHSAENALKDEQGVVRSLGMQYIHIPVDFKNPTTDDFSKFAEAMQAAGSDKVWVHCAANMRVSAFIFKYRRDVLGERREDADADLAKIWEPMGVWKAFLARD